ncbi:glycerate kinase [Alkalinema sp. FACHB-956]|uniref:glycerate kinase n=1 Tax=Alkalinema sp. FACHB-956 TaxID=2692768 RepID=UPI001687CA7B|nr:glycerate kinase [Alkalinema sp. FACHB-956]MBD2328875.1 glycerate kinase [Alkalinema sp. FACHB-956]
MGDLSQPLQEFLAGQASIATVARQLAARRLVDPGPQAVPEADRPSDDPQALQTEIEARLTFLQRIYADFQTFSQALAFPEDLLPPLWQVWIPLAQQIAEWRKQQAQPLIVGFLGGQGTGKTTLTQILAILLQHLGQRAIGFSLDDLYLTYAERQALRLRDPRLDRRGPPGTHDVELGLTVLEKIRSQQFPVDLPRFDKSAFQGAGDRRQSERIALADVVLFEGWFVGCRPVAPFMFDSAPEPIVTEADRQFARDMNRNLYAYQPLWELLDRLIVLQVPDYRLSIQWRCEAEHRMIAQGKPGMSDAEITDFVKYFWKALHPELFIQPLLEEPQWVDRVIDIQPNHLPCRIYCP